MSHEFTLPATGANGTITNSRALLLRRKQTTQLFSSEKEKHQHSGYILIVAEQHSLWIEHL